jgi:hypothetical protein
MRFSDWQALHDGSDIPVASGLFQVRVKGELLRYPLGKTAMFYYGYAANLEQGCQLFVGEILPLLAYPADELLLRTMATADVDARFRALLHKFSTSFGSLPKGNVAYLEVLQRQHGTS